MTGKDHGKKRYTGARIFVESLVQEGVEVVFGLPGGAVLNIYDEIMGSHLRHVLVRHEQGAVHMADGYARSTGKVGVALVTSGPGATNTVTGIATAYMDSVPLVVFTGQVPTALVGNDAFQEADIVGITRPCTKHNYLVKDVKDLSRTIKEAFYIASTGRPGPVLVDIPKDLTQIEAEFSYPDRVDLRSYRPVTKGHAGQIKKAIERILRSSRPVVYIGGGVVSQDAGPDLLALAEALELPVASTLMGLGGFPGDHPQFLGMLGMHGTYAANLTINNSDLILAIGARFDDRVTGKVDEFAPQADIIHIDIDPASISKNVEADIPIVGGAREILREMNRLLKEDSGHKTYRKTLKEWWSTIRDWQKTQPLTYTPSSAAIKPQYLIEQIYELTKGKNAIMVTGVGQHQMWVAQYYKFHSPRTFLTSGGLGTMGYGFPAGIGAKVAFPERDVVVVEGDGSVQMNIQELATAVQDKIGVKVAIVNNGFLGMVRQWQQLFYKRRYSETRLAVQPDFVKLAQAYGAQGFRAEKPEEVVPVLKKGLTTPGPVLMDFVVEPEENVYPMVPAGAPINKMILV